MFRGTTTKSWLEEELERERKGISKDETWWAKLWRGVKDIFVKRERDELNGATFVPLDERIIEIPRYDEPNTLRADTVDLINRLVMDGTLTMNEARAAMGLPPVDSDESVILYADDRPVVETTRRPNTSTSRGGVRRRAIQAALTANRLGISR